MRSCYVELCNDDVLEDVANFVTQCCSRFDFDDDGIYVVDVAASACCSAYAALLVLLLCCYTAL